MYVLNIKTKQEKPTKNDMYLFNFRVKLRYLEINFLPNIISSPIIRTLIIMMRLSSSKIKVKFSPTDYKVPLEPLLSVLYD